MARADMFTVTDVPIQATAESAAAAKAVAIADGQLRAFAKLIERVTSPQDAGLITAPTAETLQSVVAGFSLDNERTSATEYLADLTVRFNGEAVEYLLSQSGVKLAVEQAAPVLVVPVYWTGDSAVVWEGNNPWRAVWERLNLDNRLVPALLPLGDASDALIESNSLIRTEPAAMDLLRGRYGVEFAFVSIVAIDQASGRVEAALTGAGPLGPMDLRAQTEAQPGQEAQAFETVARELLDKLDLEWRNAVATDPFQVQSQSVAIGVPFGTLQEWVGIRSRLELSPGVEKVDVRALNANSAIVDVSYVGELQQLAAALESQGLHIYDSGNGLMLRLR